MNMCLLAVSVLCGILAKDSGVREKAKRMNVSFVCMLWRLLLSYTKIGSILSCQAGCTKTLFSSVLLDVLFDILNWLNEL